MSLLAAPLFVIFLTVPSAPPATSNEGAPAAPPVLAGRVLEAVDASGYTYVRLQRADGEPAWAVGPHVDVAPGDDVTVPKATAVEGHRSTALQRDFSVVWFAAELRVTRRAPALDGVLRATAAPDLAADEARRDVHVSNIERAPGGMTVEEIYEDSAKLAGKPVTLRAQVVRLDAGSKGVTWLRLRDGSGMGARADVPVATKDTARVGDVVVVTGTVALEHDLGDGTSYPLAIVNAAVR